MSTVPTTQSSGPQIITTSLLSPRPTTLQIKKQTTTRNTQQINPSTVNIPSHTLPATATTTTTTTATTTPSSSSSTTSSSVAKPPAPVQLKTSPTKTISLKPPQKPSSPPTTQPAVPSLNQPPPLKPASSSPSTVDEPAPVSTPVGNSPTELTIIKSIHPLDSGVATDNANNQIDTPSPPSPFYDVAQLQTTTDATTATTTTTTENPAMAIVSYDNIESIDANSSNNNDSVIVITNNNNNNSNNTPKPISDSTTLGTKHLSTTKQTQEKRITELEKDLERERKKVQALSTQLKAPSNSIKPNYNNQNNQNNNNNSNNNQTNNVHTKTPLYKQQTTAPRNIVNFLPNQQQQQSNHRIVGSKDKSRPTNNNNTTVSNAFDNLKKQKLTHELEDEIDPIDSQSDNSSDNSTILYHQPQQQQQPQHLNSLIPKQPSSTSVTTITTTTTQENEDIKRVNEKLRLRLKNVKKAINGEFDLPETKSDEHIKSYIGSTIKSEFEKLLQQNSNNNNNNRNNQQQLLVLEEQIKLLTQEVDFWKSEQVAESIKVGKLMQELGERKAKNRQLFEKLESTETALDKKNQEILLNKATSEKVMEGLSKEVDIKSRSIDQLKDMLERERDSFRCKETEYANELAIWKDATKKAFDKLNEYQQLALEQKQQQTNHSQASQSQSQTEQTLDLGANKEQEADSHTSSSSSPQEEEEEEENQNKTHNEDDILVSQYQQPIQAADDLSITFDYEYAPLPNQQQNQSQQDQPMEDCQDNTLSKYQDPLLQSNMTLTQFIELNK
ncbi:hypothetical protein DFA_02715 [Cavenderia fasciculata]|uniref:Uncharacterized protein n=1 Tax=Cavenderia fasciculata TaxID=261658 RepID=F4PHY5_CACFS|nr:uncharacterized protein DFA_02715 [Cavenderia fasciculata]EGG24472.1 hypothetical protein DFA_02715 [Cavenderia fasciculata]|eukprot:XP_004362323.1 hypothetical protein DFA_02715 [Cavenderia fasciculata]